MNKLLDQLKTFLESDEGKLFIEKQQREIVFMKNHYTKYIDKLNKMGKTKRDELFNKIKEKYASDEYYYRWMKRSIFPPHYLYDYIYEYAIKYGIKEEEGYIIDNKWFIRIIIGQGTEFIFCNVDEYKKI